MFLNEVQKKSVNGAGCEAERHERSELPERSFFTSYREQFFFTVSRSYRIPARAARHSLTLVFSIVILYSNADESF